MKTFPEGFAVRCPTMDEIPPVLALLHTKELADFGEVSTTEKSLQEAWQAPDFNLSTDAWMVTTQKGQIIGYARVWHYQYIPIYLQFVVLPGAHEEEINVLLLRLAEQRARDYAALAPRDTVVALRTVTAETNHAHQDLLMHLGYHKLRSRCRMDMPLAPFHLPVCWPVGIMVRPCVPERDLPAIFATQDEAFAHPAGYPSLTFEQWRRLNVPEEDFDPSLWLVAEEKASMVGICLCSCRGSEGTVGTLAVRHQWRGIGLGQALLSQSCAELSRRGMESVRLFVDLQNPTGAIRLYERMGMHITNLFHQYEKVLSPGNLAGNSLAGL